MSELEHVILRPCHDCHKLTADILCPQCTRAWRRAVRAHRLELDDDGGEEEREIHERIERENHAHD